MKFVHCRRCMVDVSPSGRRVLTYPDIPVTPEQMARVCETMSVIRASRGAP